MTDVVKPDKQKIEDDAYRLKVLRGERAQATVAEEADMAQSLLSELESGVRTMTSWSAEKLAPVLGDEVHEMVADPADDLTGTISVAEAGQKVRPRRNAGVIRDWCRAGRIPGAKKMKVATPYGTKRNWRVPENFVVFPTGEKKPLSMAEKNKIASEYLIGKTGKELAAAYGVDSSYPSHLVARGYPKDKKPKAS